MPAWEIAQIALGLAIPPLIMIHVIGTKIAADRQHLTPEHALGVVGRDLLELDVLVLLRRRRSLVGRRPSGESPFSAFMTGPPPDHS